MMAVLAYFRRMLSEGDGLESVRRHAFALAVVNCIALCWAGLWVDLKTDVVTLALGLFAGTTTSVTAGRFAEREK
jgi:hypothetical protein